MLILKRKEGQKILLAGGAEEGGVTIYVCRCNSGSTKIGIEADRSLEILRDELIEPRFQSERLAENERV